MCSSTDKVCKSKAKSLNEANYLDIDYDAISQMLVVTMFRHELSSTEGWNEKVQISEEKRTVEVGVFVNENPIEPEEISLGGFQAIVDKDKKPSKEILMICPYLLANPPSQTQLGSRFPRATIRHLKLPVQPT